MQEAVGALADLDEQIADAHAALQAQMAQQLALQEALRCGGGSTLRWHLHSVAPCS